MNFDAWIDVCDKTKGFIKDSESVYAHSIRIIKDFRREHLIGLYLDTNHKLIHSELISLGSVCGMVVMPSAIFKPAIIYSASFIVIAHNHPSCYRFGKVRPSKADDLFTDRICKAGEILDLKIKDHMIIGNNKYYSYRDEKRFGLK